MEGRHSVAGPWFAVHQVGGDWQTLDEIYLSNGHQTTKVKVQSQVSWEDERA